MIYLDRSVAAPENSYPGWSAALRRAIRDLVTDRLIMTPDFALSLEWPCLAGHNRGGADCAADCPDRSSGLQIRILTIVLARTGVDEVCNALNRKAVGQARPGRRKIIPRRAWRRRHRAPLALSSHRVRPPGPYRACRRRPCRRALPRLCAPARRH